MWARQQQKLSIAVSSAILSLIVVSLYLSRAQTPIPTAINSARPVSGEPAGENTTRTLVIAKQKEDNTEWVDALALQDSSLTGAVYTVDDPSAELTVPQNKGHEVMVYLTYIIDHYDDGLPDVTIFMHPHQLTWHNNDFLNWNSSLMIQRLKSDHVLRSGYVNLRCHHDPGCPDHIHPMLDDNDLVGIPEAPVVGNSWPDLFPGNAVPEVLSQPCCAQFAVSRERLRSIPRDKYLGYREWLLNTRLDDQISGRVWEYVWQYLFAGVAVFCPAEHVCYCEMYGVCFNDKAEYDRFFELRAEARVLDARVKEIEDANPPDPISKSRAKEANNQKFTLLDEMGMIKAAAVDGSAPAWL